MAFGITTFAEAPFAATGSVNVNVAVTGEQLNFSQTSPSIIIDVTVSLTGQEITATQGNVDIFTGALVSTTGTELTSSIGTVSASKIDAPDALSMSIASVGITA